MCRLNKDLYGLKKAPRAWYSRIDEYLMSLASSRVLWIPTFTIRLLAIVC